ncbi:DNA-binding transcriptional LysR family regulator [Actinoplanes campanulatus]|uniref:DNA-binding transcriptional LysR family regulator n=1 Tax=Actinoplanes campanulatus TaxID=113559 RepID=A0A7W5ACV6_9ACTN|nr:LysR family transcriptional regulator [Actinoplanes campanulatus]MBB3093494.1 DNA-binding transcriptional LysR family regulator [Actinoplanes campanulatus]GGN03749.1 LysR family transcriptional regulator [Actinoplanes campanulatus]GID35433.1 LysR family transcriptional regulator [Actinoplanes campanulatus]
MDPHLLRTFVTVAETGSFSAAAERLNFTQSAVSQQIAALEADLGTPLLTRRPVALTPAGERLHRHATLILVRLEAARADVTRAVAPPGRLIVGLTPLAWTRRVAAALARIRAEPGRLRSRVLVAGRDRIVAAAVTGEIDLGIVDGFTAPSDPLPLPEAGAVGIAEDTAVVAVPAGHPLARRATVNLADLVDAYWIDAPEVTPFARLPVDGLRVGLRYDGADVAILRGLIAAGHGLAVLPAKAVGELTGIPVLQLTHRVELLRGPGAEAPAARLSELLAAL